MISNEQELRQRFNPEGSTLRRHQMRMLEMLEIIDAICRKHKIPYWLSSGTLLGAARHKGFIPWDDDLDIELLRKDYHRLMQILAEELPPHMALQTHETDPNYIFIFAKVRDRRSYLEEPNSYDRIFKERGIYIDIFPLEETPQCLSWISEHMQGRIFNQLNNKHIDESTMLRRIQRIFHFNEHIGYPILRFLAHFFPGKKLRHSYGTAFRRPRCMKEIFPLTEMEFEGKLFPVPCDTHAFLTRYYGNYQQLPDLDKLHPHCSQIIFDR